MRPKPEPMPPRRWLRRVWPEVPTPARTLTREVCAFHEAGHVVYARWVGLPISDAQIGDSGGAANLDLLAIRAAPARAPSAEDLELRAAEVAALYCAGRQAERLLAGPPFVGVIRPGDSDHRRACEMLQHWTKHTAGLGYAQLLARAVLSNLWSEVDAVATHLIEHGRWEST